jgi:hypothetical protein
VVGGQTCTKSVQNSAEFKSRFVRIVTAIGPFHVFISYRVWQHFSNVTAAAHLPPSRLPLPINIPSSSLAVTPTPPLTIFYAPFLAFNRSRN